MTEEELRAYCNDHKGCGGFCKNCPAHIAWWNAELERMSQPTYPNKDFKTICEISQDKQEDESRPPKHQP